MLKTFQRLFKKLTLLLLIASFAGLSSPLINVHAAETLLNEQTLQELQKALAGIGLYVKTIGVHAASGMPADHVQINTQTGKNSGGAATYSAPSKLGVYFPFLLKVYQRHPLLSQTGLTRQDALVLMKKALITLKNFQIKGEGRETYAGLFPWFQMREDGSLSLQPYGGRRMIPLLDNGQATLGLWAWAGDEEIENAQPGTLEAEVKSLLTEVIENQHYEKLVDPRTGILFAEWDLRKKKGTPLGGLTLWTEWMIPNYIAAVQGHIREQHWRQVGHPIFSYQSDSQGPLDMPQGFIFSMHELWELVYMNRSIMQSRLAPLLRNYLYLQAEHSTKNNMPGIVATEYGPDGYTSAGIQLNRGKKGKVFAEIRNEHLATAYGSSLTSLIEPSVGTPWTLYNLKQPGVVQPFGPVTSFTRDFGATGMITADSTFITAVGLAGGVNEEVSRYIYRRYGKTEAELIRMFNLHADDLLSQLGRPFRSVSVESIPLPPQPGDFSIQGGHRSGSSRNKVDISGKLLKDFHGENVNVPRRFESWKASKNQKWVMARGQIVANYSISGKKRFAWLGTQVQSVAIRGTKFISVWVPADLRNEYWELEFKNDSEEIIPRVGIKTSESGELSSDRNWKRLIIPVTMASSENRPLNYFAISVPDPTFAGSLSKRQGAIMIKDIELFSYNPAPPKKESTPERIPVPVKEKGPSKGGPVSFRQIY